MADKIVVLNAGRIEQVGSPLDLYHRPATEFVAGFIGSPAMNLFDASSVFGAAIAAKPAAHRLGIRPEHVPIGPSGAGDLDLDVAVKEQLGGESYLYLRSENGERIVVKTDGEDETAAGDRISIKLPMKRVHQFGADGVTLADTQALAS